MMMPAWAAIIPDLVPKADLPAAVALNSMGMNISRAIGPAVAGAIVAASGPWVVFTLNAASFLAVMGVLLRWKPPERQSTLKAERFIGAFFTGFGFARHSPDFQAVLLRGAAFFAFASAPWAFLPLIARQELGGGPEIYGVLLACIGVGAVTGAFLLPKLQPRITKDIQVAGATVLYAGAGLVLAHVRDVALLGLSMFILGIAWIAVMSSLQVSAQTALPGWVRARGLAIFMMVFMGGMAGGSMLWGQLATSFGIPMALTVASVAALVGIALTWKFHLTGLDVDLTPSMHWPTPLVENVDQGRGPVMITVQYGINPEKVNEFLRALSEMRRIRRRDGAIFWEVFRDIKDPSRIIESFMVESWEEHLRQHERITKADVEIEQKVRAFHTLPEPPVVSHLIAEKLADR
jgi:predicted MFS family arabinose efflux permease/quinol monooxygenase YgiN